MFYKQFQDVLVSIKKWSTYVKVTTTVLTPLCRYFYILQHAYNMQLRELNNKGARAKKMAQAIFLEILMYVGQIFEEAQASC